MLSDNEFVAGVADRLAALPNVRAVTLGGSRAAGTHGPDSDWDFALYYRDRFDPADLRAVGWAGEVSELGAWGGVFNGGAWLTIDGRPVDVHYRDLTVVEHEYAGGRATDLAQTGGADPALRPHRLRPARPAHRDRRSAGHRGDADGARDRGRPRRMGHQ